jgi:D-serine deaminase-like pyridoxal phosphate-dependent protein
MESNLQIQKPTLVINKDKVLSNLRFMILKAQSSGAELHPHYKTHQSTEVGFWALGEGIDKITVSSVTMAEKFIEQANSEITIAFPINRLEIDSINRLAQRCKLILTVCSESSVLFLDKHLEHSAGISIKIDTGYGRAGILPEQNSIIEDIIQAVNTSDKLNLHSFMAHSGHNYHTDETAIILDNHKKTVEQLDRLKKTYSLKTSLGDTPACTLADNFGNTDILRPGNFFYYDLMQYRKSVCKIDDIAVSVMCPAVSKVPHRNEIILYGGAVHFSKEYLEMPNGEKNFGQPVIRKPKESGIPDGTYLRALSQEHGILKCSKEFFNSVEEGDVLEILPIHSCLTANLLLHSSVVV